MTMRDGGLYRSDHRILTQAFNVHSALVTEVTEYDPYEFTDLPSQEKAVQRYKELIERYVQQLPEMPSPDESMTGQRI